MTDEPSYQTDSDPSPAERDRPLPVTIVPGMQVVDMSNDGAGTIVGITQGFCIYRIDDTEGLSVARWEDMALGGICPADPLLPADVTENDRRNWSAHVLRELLGLAQFGLTATQTAAYDELIAFLCQKPEQDNKVSK